MSPIALELLSLAYKNYEKTFDRAYSYQFRNSNEMVHSIEAAQQLYEDGYIENVSDFIFESSISFFSGPITFELTNKGIEYMCSNRKL